MYQAKSGVKNFSLYWGGESLDKKFFSQSEHVAGSTPETLAVYSGFFFDDVVLLLDVNS